MWKNNKLSLTKINLYLSAILLVAIAFIYSSRLYPFYEFSVNLRDNSFLTEESYSIAQTNLYVFILNWIAIICVALCFFMKNKHVGNIVSILFLVFTTMYLTKESLYMDEVKFFREEILQKSVITDKAFYINRDHNKKEDKQLDK